ncbi:hypothetical protein F5890DRAFT_1528857, partial [Lentinula detonsa]
MMVFSRSVLTTFLVVGTSSSVLALPFQSFSGTGLPRNDVASTATTQAMPTIPTGYVQGQSVGVQEDAVKNHDGASNSPSPSGLAHHISMDARALDEEQTADRQPTVQDHLRLLAQFGPKPSNPGNPTSSGSDKQTRRDLFDTRNVEIESPPEPSCQVRAYPHPPIPPPALPGCLWPMTTATPVRSTARTWI